MKLRYLNAMVGLAIALCTGSAVRAATIYDLGAQWSNTVNPNGAWTYREGNTALPQVAGYSFAGTIGNFTPQAAWAPSNAQGSFLPVWLQSSQTGTPIGFTPGAVLPGDVIVHSRDQANGSGQGDANVIWTSPSAGTIDISGDIWWVRTLGRTNDFSVSVGGTVIASGSIADGGVNTRSNPLQFSSGLLPGFSFSTIPVTAGEIVELAVTSNSASSAGEISGLNFQIAESGSIPPPTVPEPQEFALIGLGLVFTAGLGKRLKRFIA